MDSVARVTALIPAYNEADRIGSTISAVRSQPAVSRIVVIDDGSKDATSQAAKDSGASAVLSLAKNQGKGAALTAGYAEEKDQADIFLLLDADLGPSAAECIKLLIPLIGGQADMTIGLLPPDTSLASDGRLGGGTGLVVGLARWGLQKRTGLTLAQPLSGQRAIRHEVLEALGGRMNAGFGVEVGLTAGAAQRGFRILEVETAFRHRVTGDDWTDLVHRARQLFDVALALYRTPRAPAKATRVDTTIHGQNEA